MIIENAFFTEIQLNNGNFNEFVEKCWYALNVHKVYPNEQINPDAFLDWARDLIWIKQDYVVVVVKGNIDKETRETIEFLNEYWDEEIKELEKSENWKKVFFIIVG